MDKHNEYFEVLQSLANIARKERNYTMLNAMCKLACAYCVSNRDCPFDYVYDFLTAYSDHQAVETVPGKHVWVWCGYWWFSDETGGFNGPFTSNMAAKAALNVYVAGL